MYLRYAKRHLCRTHLIADIEQRVLSTVEKNNLISPGDRIAVALSGGKDSTALLILLCMLLPAWNDVSLVAITIDEGITGYREDTVRSAEDLTQRLGIEHHCISFTEQFGDPLDALLKGRESQACSICGILRKKALNLGAQGVGATKLATGHNLDDEAQSVLMNVLRGDLPRLVRNSGNDSSGAFIRRIKPLAYISEKEIATYLMLNDAWTSLPECPYTRYALRREVRTMLTTLEYRHPGTMLHLMESKQKIEHYCAGSMVGEPIRHCRECGDPCSGDICQVCLLRHSLDRK
jgi:uncharacterized protein (TIGR00269 family)